MTQDKNTMPERIYAEIDPDYDGSVFLASRQRCTNPAFDRATEYIRADLSPDTVPRAVADKMEAALVAVMDDIKKRIDNIGEVDGYKDPDVQHKIDKVLEEYEQFKPGEKV
jgi:hypothetical protein